MTEPATDDRRLRLDGLTGARSFAAAAVLLHHYGPVADVRLRPVTALGYLGVAFFFALSGFVLTLSSRPGSARAFYRRRFARVWPTHAVALLFAVLVGGAASVGPVLANVVLLQGWIPSDHWYYGGNFVAWSLCSEAFFYALTPWLLPRISGRQPLRSLVWLLSGFLLAQLVLMVALPLFTRLWAGYILPLAGLPIFLAGMIVARGVADQTLPRVPARSAAAVLIVSLLGAFGVQEALSVTGRYDPAGRGLLIALTLPAFLLVIAAVAQRERAGHPTWLAARPLVRLGEWSFALYLVHATVLVAVTDHSRHTGWGWVGLAVVAAIALSCVLHLAVEKPLEKQLRTRGEVPVRNLWNRLKQAVREVRTEDALAEVDCRHDGSWPRCLACGRAGGGSVTGW